MTAEIDANFRHHGDGFGPHERRLRTGGRYLVFRPHRDSHQPFSHLTARGIARAKDQDSFHDLLLFGTSHPNTRALVAAPANCATMKPGASAGRIPANVSVRQRANATAGLANDVDAVNQY